MEQIHQNYYITFNSTINNEQKVSHLEPAWLVRALQETQLGPDGLGLGFGTITVIDDVLTAQPELGSQIVGKAKGVYVASSADGSRQMMTFTALFEGGEYGDSLNFCGLYKIGSAVSQLSVIGGTGKFKNTNGFAKLRALVPPGQVSTDGAETLLRITVYLNY
ncbi:hypothetical protein AHAS_Ahas04G0043500 [Arachis hypogaea]